MIKVYSTNCPKCRILVKKLNDSGLEFEVIDNLDEVLAASEEFNIQEAPFSIIDEKAYNFMDTIKFINNR